jgi:hypothetical protein
MVSLKTPWASLGTFQGIEAGCGGPVSASLRPIYAARGHPRIEVTYPLFAREKRVDVAIALLKDPTPLIEAYAAFPFTIPRGRFRYSLTSVAGTVGDAHATRRGAEFVTPLQTIFTRRPGTRSLPPAAGVLPPV